MIDKLYYDGFICLDCLSLVYLANNIRYELTEGVTQKRIRDFVSAIMAGHMVKSPQNHQIAKEEEQYRPWEGVGFFRFNSARASEFYKQAIEPYAKVLVRAGYMETVLNILHLLEGCKAPSVLSPKIGDCEYENFGRKNKTQYMALAEISLLKHSLLVAETILFLANTGSTDYEAAIGPLLIVALGHDIGKIPLHYGQNWDNAINHAAVSAYLLEADLPKDLTNRREIIEAVHVHHSGTRNAGYLAGLLRQADRLARSKELSEMGFGMDTGKTDEKQSPETCSVNEIGQRCGDGGQQQRYRQIDLDWLDTERLMHEAAKIVNVVKNGRFEAFQYYGYVYFFPEALVRAFIEVAKQVGRFEFVFGHDRETMNDLAYSLRRKLAKHVGPEIGDGFIGQRYELVGKSGKRIKGFFISISINAFTREQTREFKKRKRIAAPVLDIEKLTVAA